MKLQKMKQKGFTMIELVIVIAILGILAAFALPRFVTFTQEAKISSIDSIVGTLNASIGIVQAKYIAGGSQGDTVILEDMAIPVTNTGTIDIIRLSQPTCGDLAGRLLKKQLNSPGELSAITSGRPARCYIFYDSYYRAYFDPGTNKFYR